MTAEQPDSADDSYVMRLNISLDPNDELEQRVAQYHAQLPPGIKVHFFKMLIIEAMQMPDEELDLKFGRMVRAFGTMSQKLGKHRGRGRPSFDLKQYRSQSGAEADKSVSSPGLGATVQPVRQPEPAMSVSTPVSAPVIRAETPVYAGEEDFSGLVGGRGW